MTFKLWLARQVQDLISVDVPPTPSRESTTSTTTPSTSTARPDPMIEMAKMMVTMMEKSQSETRELVLSILQGRPSQPSDSVQPTLTSPDTLPVPNYDDDSIPLPGGIMAVFSREEEEAEELRLLQTEQQRLKDQLRDAQIAYLTDPQGPDSMSSS